MMRFSGEWQSTFHHAGRVYLGIGDSPADSRKMALEAADLRPDDRLPLGTYHMVTEYTGCQLSNEGALYD
jgi:hypothetical protein